MIDELHQDVGYLWIQLFAKFVIGLLLGYFLGRARPIGMAWTTFFSVTFWPIGALIFVLFSPKIGKANTEKSRIKLILGSLVLVLGVGLFVAISSALMQGEAVQNHPIILFTWIIGFIGGGLYLILRAGGRSFHSN